MNDDYVKRTDVHKAFQPKYAPAINKTFAAMIDSVPAADVVERRTGIWLHEQLLPDNVYGHMVAECSVCHEVRIVDNYCPNCGSKNEVGQDEQH